MSGIAKIFDMIDKYHKSVRRVKLKVARKMRGKPAMKRIYNRQIKENWNKMYRLLLQYVFISLLSSKNTSRRLLEQCAKERARQAKRTKNKENAGPKLSSGEASGNRRRRKRKL